ncbi:RCC1 and BTB domain-containing protein, partial [Trifolium medium]|nr:RCC1 and BTB domain-containing protein [Trifolium medium]
WGWKECIPSGKVFGETLSGISAPPWRWSKLIQVSPRSKVSKSTGGTVSGGEISTKRRKVSSAKQAAETSSSGDDILTAMPCLVTLNPGVRITSVAAGGRHTLVLSEDQICSLRHVINCNVLNFLDIGQVWGWGYGGEGQLGLGSRIRMVSSPHLIPCIDSSSYSKDISASLAQGSMSSEGQNFRIPGSCIKAIACGGRHSAVIT